MPQTRVQCAFWCWLEAVKCLRYTWMVFFPRVEFASFLWTRPLQQSVTEILFDSYCEITRGVRCEFLYDSGFSSSECRTELSITKATWFHFCLKFLPNPLCSWLDCVVGLLGAISSYPAVIHDVIRQQQESINLRRWKRSGREKKKKSGELSILLISARSPMCHHKNLRSVWTRQSVVIRAGRPRDNRFTQHCMTYLSTGLFNSAILKR